MARKKKHEEHVNAEAWAIPYGDLVTLLFALFTVMYAMSSVNEGKFRVLSDSLIAAFHGAPKSIQPVNIGDKEPGKGGDKPLVGLMPTALMKLKDQKTARGRRPARSEPVGGPRLERGARRADPHGARGAECDAGAHRRQAGHDPPREHVARDRDQHGYLVPERLGRVRAGGRAGARQARGRAEAVPESDPGRGSHRRSARSRPPPFPPTGSCPRPDRRAWCTSSPGPASIRCASRSSASASTIRAKATRPPKGATRIGESPSWCSSRWRRALRSPPRPTATRRPQAAPGVATADANSAENRLLWRVQPSNLEKTVLVKDQAKRDVIKDSAAVKDSPVVETTIDSPPLSKRGHSWPKSTA